MSPSQGRPPKINKDYTSASEVKSNKGKVALALQFLRGIIVIIVQWITTITVLIGVVISLYLLVTSQYGYFVFTLLATYIAVRVNGEVK